MNLPYYLSHFIKINPLFDIDLFSRIFDMESPICTNILLHEKSRIGETKHLLTDAESCTDPKKSRIQKTKHLSTNADRSTDTKKILLVRQNLLKI